MRNANAERERKEFCGGLGVWGKGLRKISASCASLFFGWAGIKKRNTILKFWQSQNTFLVCA